MVWNKANVLTGAGEYVSAKARLPHNWIIALYLDKINELRLFGQSYLVPENIAHLESLCANMLDETYKLRLQSAEKEIYRRAKKLYPLKPSDLKTHSDVVIAKANYVNQQYYNAMLRELIMLFQRKNVIPPKSRRDIEVDLDYDNIG